jgi:hypothetical protein
MSFLEIASLYANWKSFMSVQIFIKFYIKGKTKVFDEKMNHKGCPFYIPRTAEEIGFHKNVFKIMPGTN